MKESTWVGGLHAISALLETQANRVLEMQVDAKRQDARLRNLRAQAEKADIPVNEVTRAALDSLFDGVHQGVLARLQCAREWNEAQLDELLQERADEICLLVLDGVTDPHNLGACMRTANGAGVAAVIVPKDRSASLNATVRKVACGAADITPLVRVTNLARTLDHLKSYGLQIIGTSDDASGIIGEMRFPRAMALVMGAEGKGMRRLTRERCDQLVSIPLQGQVSSLNVSVATGVCLFEYCRQHHYASSEAGCP